MKPLLTVVLILVVFSPVSVCTQGFVYPVGNQNERPTAEFSNPNGYVITQDFMNEAGHTGVDLANGEEGGEVRAIGPGIVSLRRNTTESAGFGNIIIIHHDPPNDTFYSFYAHMQESSVSVSEGDVVVAGQAIGRVDCTGNTRGTSICESNNGRGPHLHFAVKQNDSLGCGYIRQRSCTSGDSFNNYADPLQFIADRMQPPPEPEPELVLQPGPGEGKDIWTTSVFCYCPGGGGPGGGRDDHELVVGGFGDLYHTPIEFDLNGMPAHASSARLELYPFTQRGSGTVGMYLDRITEFWDWKTMGTGSDNERLWWADRPTAVQWIPNSLPAPTIGQWYSINITDLYNAWQDGTHPNYGLQLRPVSTNDRWSEFYSSDYVDDPSLRPRLVVVK